VPDPCFIVGTERSGSYLLRLVLNSHSRLCVPHPPHVLRYLGPLERSYGDLSDDRSFHAMARDVALLIRWHIHPWCQPPTAEALVADAPFRSLLGLYAAAYESHMRVDGKARWGCKSTFMIHEAPRVLEAWPGARFILLVRDPRDVAVSARASVFNHFHPYFTARLWRDEQRKGLDLPVASTLRMHYESLLVDPEGEVRRLCAFLGEDFEPAMLRFFETDEARRSAALCQDWRNTGRGILRDNAGRFQRSLSRAEIALVEAVAEDEMRALGYDLCCGEDERRAARTGAACRLPLYWLAEQATRCRVEWRSLRQDRNFWLRARRELLVGWLALKAWLRGLDRNPGKPGEGMRER